MPDIAATVHAFVRALADAGVAAKLGSVTVVELERVGADVPLSDELRAWYREVSLSDVEVPWYGNRLVIYHPLELNERQVGYRVSTSGESQPESVWPASWLVIGDVGADPLIAHTDRAGTPMSIAVHGVGAWTPQPFAPDLATLFRALRVWVEICLVRHGGAFLDDDSLHLPGVRRELAHGLSQVLDDESLAHWPFEDFT